MTPRKRKRSIYRYFYKVKHLVQDIKNCRRNSMAAASARYILDDVKARSLAKMSGLPLGVITNAYRNIFSEYYED